MQKLNVVLLVAGYPSDQNKAKGIFNQRAAEGLKDKVNLTVIHIRGWRPGWSFIRRENYQGIDVIRVCIPRIPSRQSTIQWLNDQIRIRISWILLRNFLQNVDIIHSVFITYGGLIGSYWKKKLGNKAKVKHITEIIGSDVNAQLSKYLNAYKYSFWPSGIDGILANSIDLKRALNSLLPDFKNIVVAYKGINLKRFNHLPPVKKTNKAVFEILFMGGFPMYKGLTYGQNIKGGITLMKAWELLEEKTDVSKVRLSIGGPASDTPFVKNWISSLKYPESINLIGYMSPDEVPHRIVQADVVVIPSMQEGLPNLLLESSLLATPVIASRVGGIPEVIEDGESGFLVDPADAAGLAAQIQKVIQRTDLDKIGLNAKENIIQNFNAQHFTFKVLETYNAIYRGEEIGVEASSKV